jgi:hypothetical protein
MQQHNIHIKINITLVRVKLNSDPLNKVSDSCLVDEKKWGSLVKISNQQSWWIVRIIKWLPKKHTHEVIKLYH